LEEQQKAYDKAFAMAGEGFLQWTLPKLGSWLATRAAIFLGAAFLVTPTGWVFVAASFTLQTAASIYLSDYIENEWKPFQTGSLVPDLP
jgi:hypothetical protein